MDVPLLTEDEMAEIKKDVLTQLRTYLCGKIKAERHLDYLRSCRILTKDDSEEIICWPTQTKRTGTLLDMLSENPRGLDALIESIQLSRTQSFIIAKITDEVQKAKNEKIESLRASCSSFKNNNLGVYGATNDLSKTLSEDSTMLFHPDGEGSPCTSDMLGSLSLNSLQKVQAVASGADGSMMAPSPAPSTLPRPGDPGAPPLPDELLAESPSNADAEPQECCSSEGDPNFQPLRSRSLTPTPQTNVTP